MTAIEICTYLSGLIAAIAVIFVTLFGLLHQRDLAYWFTCLALVATILMGFCWGQDVLWKKDAGKPLDLTDAFVERFAEVLKSERRWADNKRLVESLDRDFDRIHTAYINTFEKYRDSIEHSKEVLDLNHPVFRQIKADSRSTASERMKLLHAPSLENAGTYPELLREYFATGINLISEANPNPNIPQLEGWTPTDANDDRLSLYQALGAIFAPNMLDRHAKKARALEVIDEIIDHLQAKCRAIRKEYQRIYPMI